VLEALHPEDAETLRQGLVDIAMTPEGRAMIEDAIERNAGEPISVYGATTTVTIDGIVYESGSPGSALDINGYTGDEGPNLAILVNMDNLGGVEVDRQSGDSDQVSVQRLMYHEMGHHAAGHTTGVPNDEISLISRANEFLAKYFNETPRVLDHGAAGLADEWELEFSTLDLNDVLEALGYTQRVLGPLTPRTPVDSDNDFIQSESNEFVTSEINNRIQNVIINPTSTVIIGTEQNDLIVGGAGDNRIEGGLGNDRIIGGEGHDALVGGDGDDTIFGGEGNDWILGERGADMIFGEEGNDRISGGRGNDSLFGGDGNDKIMGAEGNDYLSGGDGRDTLRGGRGNDTLFGDDGNDRLEGNNGHDVAFGGNGNDVLVGGRGNDILAGGNGRDILHGQEGSDIMLGGAGADKLYGGNGADRIYGGDDNDVAFGANGNDVLYGGLGDDRLHGGNGGDKLYGSEGNDILHGNRGNDELYGGEGQDELRGGRGNDKLYAGDDNIDQPWCGTNAFCATPNSEDGSSRSEQGDKLYGGAGRDELYGSTASDHMWGGSGADQFFLAENYGDNIDTIYDFSIQENDALHITNILKEFDESNSDLNDFFKINDNGNGEYTLFIDQDGAGTKDQWDAYAVIHSSDDLSDEVFLASNHIVIS
jgi:Ca2+-binding RTX toxin-like protein